MARVLLLLLALMAAPAWAEVELLPGSSPQHALARDLFAPIRVRVTQAGVPYAGAELRLDLGVSLTASDPLACFPNVLALSRIECPARTDSSGIAEFLPLKANWAGTYEVTIRATDQSQARSLGSVTAILVAEPRTAPFQLAQVSGNDQRGVLGDRFRPVSVRLLDPAGRPAAGREVTVNALSDGGARFGVDAPANAYYYRTDSEGYFTTATISAGHLPGDYKLYVSYVDNDAAVIQSIEFRFRVVTQRGDLELKLTNMWWAGPAETGWGISVVKHGDAMFNVLFIYDEEGKPTWYVQPQATFGQALYPSVIGALYSPRSAPWFAYDASRFVVGSVVGTLQMEFDGEIAASLKATLGGRGITRNIKPQDFTGDRPSPLEGVADMWWGGPSQNGWGMAIHEQFGNLFAVWFTYAADGKPTWFVMPGGEWRDGRTYAGALYRTSASPWIEGPYDASQLRVGAVGTYALRFEGLDTARFEYVLDGRAGTLEMSRQSFTPH